MLGNNIIYVAFDDGTSANRVKIYVKQRSGLFIIQQLHRLKMIDLAVNNK